MSISKKSLILALGIALPITMVGCSNDSDQPSKHTQERNRIVRSNIPKGRKEILKRWTCQW